MFTKHPTTTGKHSLIGISLSTVGWGYTL